MKILIKLNHRKTVVFLMVDFSIVSCRRSNANRIKSLKNHNFDACVCLHVISEHVVDVRQSPLSYTSRMEFYLNNPSGGR